MERMMAKFIEDQSRGTLFVHGSLESLLPGNSVARTIWAGLEQLDFSEFESAYRNDEAGRPAVEPRRLAGVWILALVRGTTSSIEVARRCGEDIEFRWMLGGAPVKKSSLCTFRTDHAGKLGALSTQLLASLARADLLPGEEVAVDGSVIRAAASCKASKPRKKLKRQIEKLNEVIESKLLEDDSEDSADVLRRKQAKLKEALAEMDALGKTGDKDRITVTEPEASKKKLKNGAFAPAHNVQVATDMASGAIISAEVIEQGNDCGQLAPQLDNAEEELARVREQLDDDESAKPASPGTVCADSAYHDTLQLVDLDERGIAAVVPDSDRRPPGVADEYLAEAFKYDADRDEMTCPQGKTLKRRKLNPNKTATTYQAQSQDCEQCPFKSQCCPKAKHGRSVNRPLYPEVVNAAAERCASPDGQRCMRKRKITAEGAFARIVDLLNWRRCRTWGKRGAQAEALWRQITHNLLLLTGHWQPIMPQEQPSG
jgi:transposase